MFLAELAFLAEVTQGWRNSLGQKQGAQDYGGGTTGKAPEHLAWLARLGDRACEKWVLEITDTSTKRRQLEELGCTVEAFREWGSAIGPAIEEKKISPYAMQLTWKVGKFGGGAQSHTLSPRAIHPSCCSCCVAGPTYFF